MPRPEVISKEPLEEGWTKRISRVVEVFPPPIDLDTRNLKNALRLERIEEARSIEASIEARTLVDKVEGVYCQFPDQEAKAQLENIDGPQCLIGKIEEGILVPKGEFSQGEAAKGLWKALKRGEQLIVANNLIFVLKPSQ